MNTSEILQAISRMQFRTCESIGYRFLTDMDAIGQMFDLLWRLSGKDCLVLGICKRQFDDLHKSYSELNVADQIEHADTFSEILKVQATMNRDTANR